MINYKCSKCGAELETPSSLAGQEDTCPGCGQVCIVPQQKTRTPIILGIAGGVAAMVLALILVMALRPDSGPLSETPDKSQEDHSKTARVTVVETYANAKDVRLPEIRSAAGLMLAACGYRIVEAGGKESRLAVTIKVAAEALEAKYDAGYRYTGARVHGKITTTTGGASSSREFYGEQAPQFVVATPEGTHQQPKDAPFLVAFCDTWLPCLPNSLGTILAKANKRPLGFFDVFAEALSSVTGVEPSVALVAVLKHPSPRIREAAATALANVGGDQSVKALVSLLKDGDRSVRGQAARSLGWIADKTTLDALKRHAVEEKDDWVRDQMKDAIKEIESK